MANASGSGSTLAGFYHGLAALQASMIVQLLHPFDVIKTRFQSHDGMKQKNLVPKYDGIFNALKMIYQCEGIRGLYRGVCFTLIAHSSSNFIFFGLYGKRKVIYQQKYGTNHKFNFGLIRASLESVIISCFLTTPMWVLKTRMLLNTKKSLNGIQNFINCISEIYYQYGLKGFFRGMSLSLCLSLNGAIQILIYERLDKAFNQYFSETGRTFLKPSINGVFSKFCTSIILYPLTTVRTRIQQNQFINGDNVDKSKFKLENSKYKSVFDVAEKIWKLEGPKGFYKGVVPSLIRSAPSNAIFFFFYEFFKNNVYKF